MSTHKKAFSLIELSIVLIVIGVLVGGIVAGNSMIKAAKIQSVVSDFAKYKKAAEDFKYKYSFWPGDMPNAYDYWATDASCANSAAPTGCNGNGDGLVTGGYESLRGWQFLKITGFISGYYSGTQGGLTSYVPGTNIPVSSYNNPVGTYGIYTTKNSYDYYNATFSSVSRFAISLFAPLSGTNGVDGAMRPVDAKAIDRKIDDSLAATGYLIGANYGSTCLSAGEYDTANNSSRLCALSYQIE